MKAVRAREDAKKQAEFLDTAYNERVTQEDEASWDPIEDVVVDEYARYVDLIKHFLWLSVSKASVLHAPASEDDYDREKISAPDAVLCSEVCKISNSRPRKKLAKGENTDSRSRKVGENVKFGEQKEM